MASEPESDETNNIATESNSPQTFSASMGPDLCAGSFIAMNNGFVITPGSNFIVQVDVSNVGDAAATNFDVFAGPVNTMNQFFVTGQTNVASVAAGSTQTIQITNNLTAGRIPAGAYAFLIWFDQPNVVSEPDEDNNLTFDVVTVN